MIKKIKGIMLGKLVRGEIMLLKIIQKIMRKLQNKLVENKGADVSIEKGGWMLAVLIIVGLLIIFINKFFPAFFDSVSDKLMDMFNLIKTS